MVILIIDTLVLYREALGQQIYALSPDVEHIIGVSNPNEVMDSDIKPDIILVSTSEYVSLLRDTWPEASI